ncbi:hypothetical protein KP509_09G099900 [Ceratopteris richardii]|uniref:Uncharacterized protein n=1 Tax=Ceratopteris richardii TaxID=49495 RepID=A0A8T2U9J3_CERRI|nr:hypothetical protein KP509_09G099900 [Ceratopteris richardii]
MSDLFESASIRELQSMLMDSSLRRPKIIPVDHTAVHDRFDGDPEALQTLETYDSGLNDIRTSERTDIVEGKQDQETVACLPNEHPSNPLMRVGEQESAISIVDPKVKDADIRQIAGKGIEIKSIDSSAPPVLVDSEDVNIVKVDIENKPVFPTHSKDQQDELSRKAEEEDASDRHNSFSVNKEEETIQNMDIDKNSEAFGVSSMVLQNEPMPMGAGGLRTDDAPQGSQRPLKRGRKSVRNIVKNVEKESSAGLLESEPDKDSGDSPMKQPMVEQKRELRKRRRKPAAAKMVQKEEEDVCFVCFDGGKLILCDKRSCPKAYHVDCTGRELEFFEKKGQWFCGWHVCSQCSKSASFNCYMCPSALCGTCIKGANFLPIRKGHGLCEACYPLVHMIEYKETVNGDSVQVDFDDKETYEGLFKDYWEELKLKLSLSSEEFKKACQSRDADGIDNYESVSNNNGEEDIEDENDDSTDVEDPPTARHARLMKRKRLLRHSAPEDTSASEFEEDVNDDEDEEEEDDVKFEKKGHNRVPEFDGWASKELLDVISSLKEDPKKPQPVYLVKKLLWRYIDENKLTNSRKRGQIVCDQRLRKLFGKKLVGRFEMMKLIGLHVASTSKLLASKGRELQNNEADMVELDDAEETQLGKKKARRKGDENKRVKPDPSEYAAINVKNINLIYLKRSVLDVLRNDPELESKAVGAFVRIRVPGSANKIDACYRLVQVTGVKQIYDALDPEKVTDVILEILNLHKREEITADLVSNQELVEEECQRLRQSVRCGFIKAMRVGELEERARALREAKVKDWREFELLRLSHLRDRASEKGRKKELRECVEKLQLLSTPEEQERLLNAPFDIDADPFMDPDYESEEEEAPADDVPGETPVPQSTQFLAKYSDKVNVLSGTEKHYSHWETGYTFDSRRNFHDPQQKVNVWGPRDHSDAMSTRQAPDLEVQDLNSSHPFPSNKAAFSGSKFGWVDNAKFHSQTTNWSQGRYTRKEVRWTDGSADNVQSSSSGWRRSENIDSTLQFQANQADSLGQMVSPIQTPAPAPSVTFVPAPSGGTVLADVEKEKIWCYLDPTRTVQGPFSMEQLRKWEKTNLFPVDLRIWRITESQDASILLSDALAGRFIVRDSMGLNQNPNMMPGSLQGAHMNGALVQGINTNNFPVRQNGGNVASGVAQGMLMGPTSTQQRPTVQSFPSSMLGHNVSGVPPGSVQGPSAQSIQSCPAHVPNVPPSLPPVQGSSQGSTQGPNVRGYPQNLAGVNVLPGQTQVPTIPHVRPHIPNVVPGPVEQTNVLPGHAQPPMGTQAPHFNNAHAGHPFGPRPNHFPGGGPQGQGHNNASQIGQGIPNSSDFRSTNRQANEWQEPGRKPGPDHHFSGPSMIEGGNERVFPSKSPWRQGPGTFQQNNRETHNRGQFGRAHFFRGQDSFQGGEGRFGPRKDLFCKYFSRGMCKKGAACDFRHA